MEKRSEIRYSIVRYSPNYLKGEIINVGIILFDYSNEKNISYIVLDENNPKLSTLITHKVEKNEYRFERDKLVYYLEECNQNLDGNVGNISISSPYSKDFLKNIYEDMFNNKLFLSEPKVSLSNDRKAFSKALIKAYVGLEYVEEKVKTKTARADLKNMFEERQLLRRKIQENLEFNPYENIEDIIVRLDFGFKNGVWNYIETIPELKSKIEITKWFADMRFTMDTIKGKDDSAKLILAYKESDMKESFNDIFKLFEGYDDKIERLNIERKSEVLSLCDYIEKEAHDIDKCVG